jgi:DNA-binding LacI/PurR family transcriptional regulator
LDNNNILQAIVAQDPYTQGYKAADLLIKTIKGEETSTGKVEAVPGLVLGRIDIDAVKQWRTDNGMS